MVSLKLIKPEETAFLRQKVLRPHQSIAEMAYPNDEAPGTAHFGAFVEDQLVGIASVYPESRAGQVQYPGSKEWRLRGMAVEPELQGQGIGHKLVKACLDHVQKEGAEVFWCNARLNALRFYTSCGLLTEGPQFEIPGIGPHFVMVTHFSLK